MQLYGNLRELRSNERSDKRNKALIDFCIAYFTEKGCLDNHSDYSMIRYTIIQI